jgi:hypothetical protein
VVADAAHRELISMGKFPKDGKFNGNLPRKASSLNFSAVFKQPTQRDELQFPLRRKREIDFDKRDLGESVCAGAMKHRASHLRRENCRDAIQKL